MTIDGRTADVFEPDVPHEAGLAAIYLHGHGRESLAGNACFTEQLNTRGLRCICPDGGQSWWLDVPSPEFPANQTPLAYVRDAVVGWIEANWHISPPAIGLFGVSMGGQGVLQLAYRQSARFPVVVAISPAVDFPRVFGEGTLLDEMFPDAETARQETVVLQLRGMNWPRHQLLMCDPSDEYWFDGAERMALKLSSSGALFERDFDTTAGGHSWTYFNTQAEKSLQFLTEKLAKERRRVE